MNTTPPLTDKMRAAIEAAERAAHEIVFHVEHAVALLGRPVLTGSCGLVEPKTVEANFQQAHAALGKAIALLASTKWPSGRQA